MAEQPSHRGRPAAAALAIGDAVALGCFVLVGLISHDEGITLGGLARNALPILVAWLPLSLLLHAYSSPGWRSLLITWAIAIPVAVVARSLVLGHPTGVRFVMFLAVTLAFSLLFLVVWRGVHSAWRERCRRGVRLGPQS